MKLGGQIKSLMSEIEKINVQEQHEEVDDYQQFNVGGKFIDEEEDYIKHNKVEFMNIMRDAPAQPIIKVESKPGDVNITQQFINRLKKKHPVEDIQT